MPPKKVKRTKKSATGAKRGRPAERSPRKPAGRKPPRRPGHATARGERPTAPPRERPPTARRRPDAGTPRTARAEGSGGPAADLPASSHSAPVGAGSGVAGAPGAASAGMGAVPGAAGGAPTIVPPLLPASTALYHTPFPHPISGFMPAEDACEGCFQRTVSRLYCYQCNRFLCPSCDEKTHSVMADAGHNRVLLGAPAVGEETPFCAAHPSMRLRYYCDTCGTPACDACRSSGPHMGHAHSCVPLVDAFRSRLGMLQHSVHTTLYFKREELLRQMRAVQSVMEEVHAVKLSIERETQGDCDAVLARLRAEEGMKLAALQGDLGELRLHLASLEEFQQQLMGTRPLDTLPTEDVLFPDAAALIYGGGPFVAAPAAVAPGGRPRFDMVEMIRRYPELCAAAEKISAKPFKREIDVDPEDFKREVAERGKMEERLAEAEEQLRVKDTMIWKLMSQLEQSRAHAGSSEAEVAELGRATGEEMDKWVSMAERLTSELERFKLVCHFCGVPLNEETVNTSCQQNLSAAAAGGVGSGYADVRDPDVLELGSGRHYFAKPRSSKSAWAHRR